jgi:hypothetical protein
MLLRAKKNSIATRNRPVPFCNAPTTGARATTALEALATARAPPIGPARAASVFSWNRLQNKASS